MEASLPICERLAAHRCSPNGAATVEHVAGCASYDDQFESQASDVTLRVSGPEVAEFKHEILDWTGTDEVSTLFKMFQGRAERGEASYDEGIADIPVPFRFFALFTLPSTIVSAAILWSGHRYAAVRADSLERIASGPCHTGKEWNREN